MITLTYPLCWGSISVIIAAIFSDFFFSFLICFYIYIFTIFTYAKSFQIVRQIMSMSCRKSIIHLFPIFNFCFLLQLSFWREGRKTGEPRFNPVNPEKPLATRFALILKETEREKPYAPCGDRTYAPALKPPALKTDALTTTPTRRPYIDCFLFFFAA